MAKKVELDLIKHILQRNELDIRVISQVMEDISTELAALVDEEKPPPVKKQYVIMLSDPEGTLKGKDYTGWVMQIPEEDSPYVTEERLHRSGCEFNVTPKGRRIPVKTIAEVCESVPVRITKEEKVWVRTKEPVLVVTTSNQIPMDIAGKADN